MRIVKTEVKDLQARQLAFYRTVCVQGQNLELSKRLLLDVHEHSYSYRFVPGVSPPASYVYQYLKTNIWNNQPLETDNTSVSDYVAYVGALAEENGFDISLALNLLLEQEGNEPCLVHGDACLDNFVLTSENIIPIDPGMPRGFSLPANDIGKILQETLTHWTYIKYGVLHSSSFSSLANHLGAEPVTIASLITHWIRILKNGVRHNPVVSRYGREAVIPSLLVVLKTYLSRPGRDSSCFRTCYDHLLSEGTRIRSGL